jgi:RNA polymerase sigma-70 factor (ECF subfamily)
LNFSLDWATLFLAKGGYYVGRKPSVKNFEEISLEELENIGNNFLRLKAQSIGVAYSVLGNLGTHEDLEDVVQDACCRALIFFKSLNDQSKFDRWFLRTVQNQAKDLRRKKLQRLYREGVLGDIDVQLPHAEDFSCDKITMIRSCFRRLKKPHQVVLEFYYWHGLTAEEISDELGVTNLAVKLRLLRARRAMKKLLNQDGGSRAEIIRRAKIAARAKS